MEFRLPNRSMLCLLGLTALVVASGCAESEGYIEYSNIPGPAPNSTAAPQQTPETKADGKQPVALIEETPAPSAAPDVVISTDANVEPPPSASPSDTTPPSENSTDAGPTPAIVATNPVSVEPISAPTSVEPAEVATNGEESVGEVASGEPREIKLLIPEKQFQADGGIVQLTYDDIDLLKVLNMAPVPADAPRHFPKWLLELDGKRIRLGGFMFPTFVATGVTNFGLARDNGICCFVKQPKIYDMIEVSMADGKSTDYIENRRFEVEGTFRIDPEADDTELYQLYRIEDAVVLK